MFRKLFHRNDEPAKKAEPEPEPPYSIGTITDLVEGKIDFRIDRIEKSNLRDNCWNAYGTALVRLPSGAANFEPKVICSRYGTTVGFKANYEVSGKKRLLLFGVIYSDEDCRYIIEEVEEAGSSQD